MRPLPRIVPAVKPWAGQPGSSRGGGRAGVKKSKQGASIAKPKVVSEIKLGGAVKQEALAGRDRVEGGKKDRGRGAEDVGLRQSHLFDFAAVGSVGYLAGKFENGEAKKQEGVDVDVESGVVKGPSKPARLRATGGTDYDV